MKKIFVLDTNVLLHSPHSLLAFEDNIIILTEAVLEELDNFKKGSSDLNANARSVARFLDKLRGIGKLTDGVEMENGGTLRVEPNHRNVQLPASWDITKADNRILQVCKALQEQDNEKVILVTKDILQRIKADIIGVVAQDFENDRAPQIDEQYKGRADIYLNQEDLNKFFKEGSLKISDIEIFTVDGDKFNQELVINEFLIMRSICDFNSSALGKISRDGLLIEKLKYVDEHPFGITPRNVVQKFMQEALMTNMEEISCVILKGPAGTAKTIYSLAVGLEKVVENHEFRRMLVCRPNVTMDEDLGYLPGTEKEKIAPLMRPIMDNLEILVDSDAKKRYDNEDALNSKVQYLFDKGLIDTQAVGYLRGRSIAKTWLIVDECQNLSPKQAQGIITRISEGSKLILCGDPEQIDSPFLDSRTNGLSYIAEKMKGSPLCAQITAEDSECIRSALAAEAIKRIRD